MNRHHGGQRAGRAPKILVADDDTSIRHALRRLFERKGYVVLTASDGVEALAVIAEAAPDLVILDICMPRMDGIEVLENIPNTAARPSILMLTALGDVELAKRAVQKGAYDFLLKPFDIDYVEKNVEAAIRARG